MKPLKVIDSLHAKLPTLPMLAIRADDGLSEQASDQPSDLRQIRAPYPVMIVGMSLAHLAPNPAPFENFEMPVEVGFVVSHQPSLAGTPYVMLPDGSFGDIDRVAMVNDLGEIVPDRPMSDLTGFDLLYGRWFRRVLDCFSMLQRSTMRVEEVPLDLSRPERRERARKNLPSGYLQLREVFNG